MNYTMRRSLCFLSMCKPGNFKIKNIQYPPCNSCVHYKVKYGIAECDAFGEKNLVSNTIENDSAKICRNDEEKCGIEGKLFEEISIETMIARQTMGFLDKNKLLIIACLFWVPYIYIIAKTM